MSLANLFFDKINLETPNNKKPGLVNLSIYYTWKTLNLHTTTRNLKICSYLK